MARAAANWGVVSTILSLESMAGGQPGGDFSDRVLFATGIKDVLRRGQPEARNFLPMLSFGSARRPEECCAGLGSRWMTNRKKEERKRQ